MAVIIACCLFFQKREEEMKLFLSTKMSLENEILVYQEKLQCDKAERSLEEINKRHIISDSSVIIFEVFPLQV